MKHFLMYARSSFERSSHSSQPLLEFRFGSHHHIAPPLSTPLPVLYHSRTKSFSPYLTSSQSLAPLYQKTPRVRTLSSISARSKATSPTSANSNPSVSYQPPPPNSFRCHSYKKIFAQIPIQICHPALLRAVIPTGGPRLMRAAAEGSWQHCRNTTTICTIAPVSAKARSHHQASHFWYILPAPHFSRGTA
jgi:hypothetical protein